MLKSTRCCDKQAKPRTFCPENICSNRSQLFVASQLNTEGACGYPKNASALVTCSLGVFIVACGASSVLQLVRGNMCPNIKIMVFLLVGYAELWSLAFFSRICKMPPVMEDDAHLKCIFTGCLVAIIDSLDNATPSL